MHRRLEQFGSSRNVPISVTYRRNERRAANLLKPRFSGTSLCMLAPPAMGFFRIADYMPGTRKLGSMQRLNDAFACSQRRTLNRRMLAVNSFSKLIRFAIASAVLVCARYGFAQGVPCSEAKPDYYSTTPTGRSICQSVAKLTAPSSSLRRLLRSWGQIAGSSPLTLFIRTHPLGTRQSSLAAWATISRSHKSQCSTTETRSM